MTRSPGWISLPQKSVAILILLPEPVFLDVGPQAALLTLYPINLCSDIVEGIDCRSGVRNGRSTATRAKDVGAFEFQKIFELHSDLLSKKSFVSY
jgi:hypothetical protein